jgi:hypothetical protein
MIAELRPWRTELPRLDRGGQNCRDWTTEDAEDAEDRDSNGSKLLQHRTDRAEGIRPSQWATRPQRWNAHPSFARTRPRWDDSVRTVEGVGRTSSSVQPPKQVTIRPYDGPDD